MQTSYYLGEASTALHTDICSPVATNPTWNRLSESDRAVLEADGGPLWHALLEALDPQLVVLSVARRHLDRIRFDAEAYWRVIHILDRTGAGELRSPPYEVSARWYNVVEPIPAGRPSPPAKARAGPLPWGGAACGTESRRASGPPQSELPTGDGFHLQMRRP